MDEAQWDLQAAYRHCLLSMLQRFLAVTVSCNPDTGELEYFTQEVLSFGPERNVSHYNILGKTVTTALRRV